MSRPSAVVPRHDALAQVAANIVSESNLLNEGLSLNCSNSSVWSDKEFDDGTLKSLIVLDPGILLIGVPHRVLARYMRGRHLILLNVFYTTQRLLRKREPQWSAPPAVFKMVA